MSESPYQDSCFNMGTVLESNFSSSQATAPAKFSSISENDSIQVIVKYERKPPHFPLIVHGQQRNISFPAHCIKPPHQRSCSKVPCLCIINRAFSAISIKSTSTLSPYLLPLPLSLLIHPLAMDEPSFDKSGIPLLTVVEICPEIG